MKKFNMMHAGIAAAVVVCSLVVANKYYQVKKKVAVVESIRVLAEQGDVDALFAVGDAYWIGYGVSKDTGEAQRWWKKAFERAVAHTLVSMQRSMLLSGSAFEAEKVAVLAESERYRTQMSLRSEILSGRIDAIEKQIDAIDKHLHETTKKLR